MNLIKISRKPYLSIFLAIVLLMSSCEQYNSPVEIAENSFDYSAFNEFKNTPVFENVMQKIEKDGLMKKSSNTILEKNKMILNYVNSEVGTNLMLPDLALQLENNSSDEILNIALKNKWLSKEDVALTNSFMNDLQLKGFKVAIKNYEVDVFNMYLSPEEFAKKNTFINMIKSIDELHPKLFNNNLSAKSSEAKNWWHCAASSVALASALAGTTSCLTIVACGIAMICLYAASRSFASNCLE
jgi:hypothetical protein